MEIYGRGGLYVRQAQRSTSRLTSTNAYTYNRRICAVGR